MGVLRLCFVSTGECKTVYQQGSAFCVLCAAVLCRKGGGAGRNKSWFLIMGMVLLQQANRGQEECRDKKGFISGDAGGFGNLVYYRSKSLSAMKGAQTSLYLENDKTTEPSSSLIYRKL